MDHLLKNSVFIFGSSFTLLFNFVGLGVLNTIDSGVGLGCGISSRIFVENFLPLRKIFFRLVFYLYQF